MSTTRPVSGTSRRQWLQTSAAVVGGALVPSSLISAPASDRVAPATQRSAETSRNKVLTRSEYLLVEELTETIIPADSHSGGAKAARVAEFVEQILRDSLEDERRAMWKEGLRLINTMSLHRTGKSFVDCSSSERIAILTTLSQNDALTDLPEIRWFLDLKLLTVKGYYTSKIGIHEELEYKGNRVLAEFVGCDDHGPKGA